MSRSGLAAWAIARREWASMFAVPAGWLIIALFSLLAGGVFALTCTEPGQPASLRPLFSVAVVLLLPIAPAISMRLLSEELRTGTFEILATSPAGPLEIVVGKFIGAWMFLATMLAPSLLFGALVGLLSEGPIDVGMMATGYAGVLMVGGVYLAAGTFASSTTSSQTLAFLSTMLGLLGFVLLTTLVADRAPEWVAGPLDAIAISPRLADLARGLIPMEHVVYFASGIAVMLFAAYASLVLRLSR